MNEAIVVEIYGVSELGIFAITIILAAFFYMIAKIANGNNVKTEKNPVETNEQNKPTSDPYPEGTPDEVIEELEAGICPNCEGEYDKSSLNREEGVWECNNCDS